MVDDLVLTVSTMHPFNLPEILAILDDIVVELIQGPYCCQLWTRELAQWVQVKDIKASANAVACECHHRSQNGGRDWPLGSGNELKHGDQSGREGRRKIG